MFSYRAYLHAVGFSIQSHVYMPPDIAILLENIQHACELGEHKHSVTVCMEKCGVTVKREGQMREAINTGSWDDDTGSGDDDTGSWDDDMGSLYLDLCRYIV